MGRDAVEVIKLEEEEGGVVVEAAEFGCSYDCFWPALNTPLGI